MLGLNLNCKDNNSIQNLVVILLLVFSGPVIANDAILVFDITPKSTKVYLKNVLLGSGKFVHEMPSGTYDFTIYCHENKISHEVYVDDQGVNSVKLDCSKEVQLKNSIHLVDFEAGHDNDFECGRGCSVSINPVVNTASYNKRAGLYGHPVLKLSVNLTKGSMTDLYVSNYVDRKNNNEFQDNISNLLSLFQKAKLWINKAIENEINFSKEVGKFPCPPGSFPRRFHLCRVVASYNNKEGVGIVTFFLEVEDLLPRKISILHTDIGRFNLIVESEVEKVKTEYLKKKEFEEMLN